ncbi:MAG: sialate O-acetylesterase [Lentisphaeraceae bacterium]|nr:sialate O-acetylesterase [Lentisphaeraceae bacterium]
MKVGEVQLKNILIGDVWLGSGQSNMEFRFGFSTGAREKIKNIKHDSIRLFQVPKLKSSTPLNNVDATWQTCTKLSIVKFSAVLFYFGEKINKEERVPVGLINSSYGGSPIEQWLVGSGSMYNGMMAPFHKIPIKGLLWYQGESNVMRKNGMTYFNKQKKLIEGLRDKWDNQNLPFYYVQIAPWSGKKYLEGQLPAFWEAQSKALSIPSTGMAVATDLVPNISDIHPKMKKEVGERLALWALAKTYAHKINYSGPHYKSMQVLGNKIILSFSHFGKGLDSRDGKALSEFQICGRDGKFIDAKATIKGNKVIVESPTVKSPRNVRFGWHKEANPNLVNKDGLPAAPFKTDNWQGFIEQ